MIYLDVFAPYSAMVLVLWSYTEPNQASASVVQLCHSFPHVLVFSGTYLNTWVFKEQFADLQPKGVKLIAMIASLGETHLSVNCFPVGTRRLSCSSPFIPCIKIFHVYNFFLAKEEMRHQGHGIPIWREPVYIHFLLILMWFRSDLNALYHFIKFFSV